MASTNNVKILCRHGGDFVEASDKICYKGGKNYIVHVDRDINYDNLSTEVRKKCKLIDITSIRYQYPGRDLDSLVSIDNDDDVSTMMMEFPQSDMVIDLFVVGAQHFSALVATASEPVVHARKDLNGSNGIDVHFRPAIESNTGDIQNIQDDLHEMERNEVDDMQNLYNGASGAALMSFPDISNFNKGNGFHEMDVGNLLNSNNGPIGVAPEELNRNKETSVHITNMDTGDVRSVPNESNQKDCNEMDNAVSLPCLNVDRGANDRKEGEEFENESAFPKALSNHAICTNFEYERTNFEVSYHKARRGKLLAAERDAGFEQSTAGRKTLSRKRLAAERDADLEQSIEIVLKGIEKTNPGSTAKLSRLSDKSLRIFVAYEASIFGFWHGCPPFVILGAMKIEKYAIVCLYASSVDANDGSFPVAYAFVQSEGKENWKWFCEELAHISVLVDKIPELTFMLDPEERILEEVVRDVFPYSRRQFLLGRLLNCIDKKFPSWEIKKPVKEIKELVMDAARASTRNEFDAKVVALREKSEEAWKFIKGMGPEHWAKSHHGGSWRSINSFLFDRWMQELKRFSLHCGAGTKDVHIVPFLKEFHVLVMETFKESHEKSSTCKSFLVSGMERRLSRNKTLSKDHYVSPCGTTATEFVVSSCQGNMKKSAMVVNLQLQTCSCNCWQCEGYPCVHAIAAILSQKGDLYANFDEWITAAKYKETYSRPINPLPDDII